MREPAMDHKNIIMENVDSSMIEKIGYDENHKILKITFKGGASYIYIGVEPYHYKNIMTNVKSVGKYFNDNIKDYAEKYACFKIDDTSTINQENLQEVTREEIDNMINNL